VGSAHACLLVIGRPSSGKTSFGQRAARCHGLHFIEASDVLRSLESTLPRLQDESLLDYAVRALRDCGEDVVARKAVEQFPSSGQTVLTGFRTRQEVDFVRGAVSRSHCVGLDASVKVRYRRSAAAGVTWEAFIRRDEIEAEFGLFPAMHDAADEVLHNDLGFEDFMNAVDHVVRRFLRGRS
jgi:dephospho-CoA kinase